LVILLIVLCAGVAWWYLSTRPEPKPCEECVIPSKDYHEIVNEMLSDAERAYHAGEKKEGYGMLGQAIRTYISHTYGKGDALTSEEIISGSPGLILPEKEKIIEILTWSSLVEYAKEEPLDEQFFGFLSQAHDLVRFQKSED